MSMLRDVVDFDRDLNEATTLLNSVKQLINEREIAIKKNQKLIKIEQELRNSLSKLKTQYIPQLEGQCQQINRNPLQYSITKQEAERRMNNFQMLKTQIFQCDKSAFLSQRHDIQQMKYDQETLFKGKTDDIEMQDMVPKTAEEMAQIRKKQKEEQDQGLQEVNDLTEQILKKQKLAGQMVADSTEKLGDIDKKAERVNQKMLTMQDKFENLLKTTSNNTLWIIIIINIFVLVFLVCA